MAELKATLRHSMRRRRAAIDAGDAATAPQKACEHALTLLADAKAVAMYVPFRDELDSRPLIAALLARNISVMLPRVIARQRMLAFHPIGSLDELVTSPMGIREPAKDSPSAAVKTIDAFVVPALAFDRFGHRLGWGAGHYDATLAAAANAMRIGYAFDSQIIDSVPAESYDIDMHYLVSECGVTGCTDFNP